MKQFLIMDSKYNTVEIPGDVLRQILVQKMGKSYLLDVKKHRTQSELFDDIRAYLKRKEE